MSSLIFRNKTKERILLKYTYYSNPETGEELLEIPLPKNKKVILEVYDDVLEK